jgi:Domain of unknown function (DUF1911)/Domain of unknown function (DUF1910)
MIADKPFSFSGSRREPYLDEASYESMVAYLLAESIPTLIDDISSGHVSADNLGYAWADLGAKYLDIALLKFSAGRPVQEMNLPLQQAIDAFEKNLESNVPNLEAIDLSIQTHFVQALWMLAVAELLGQGGTQVKRVANLYAADETNDGADELFELILAQLGCKSFEASGLIHDDPYQLLLDCIRAAPEERPELMTKFLKRWYKGQKECDWWGSHVRRPGTTVLDTGFFGYWAFEAALVTFLWDIDDSSYRDLPHYPKDLADHARQLALGGGMEMPARVIGGEACPRTGYWFTPARIDSRKHFNQGDVLPKVGGDYGATIWQWDEKQ